MFNVRYELVINVINHSVNFTEPYISPQRPGMELSLPPPLTDQAQNHLTSPAPSLGLSPQGFSFPHHWQTVDGNAKEKEKQKQNVFIIISSFLFIQSLNIIIFPNMDKLKSKAHFL